MPAGRALQAASRTCRPMVTPGHQKQLLRCHRNSSTRCRSHAVEQQLLGAQSLAGLHAWVGVQGVSVCRFQGVHACSVWRPSGEAAGDAGRPRDGGQRRRRRVPPGPGRQAADAVHQLRRLLHRRHASECASSLAARCVTTAIEYMKVVQVDMHICSARLDSAAQTAAVLLLHQHPRAELHSSWRKSRKPESRTHLAFSD